jgi:hypothetical protein
MNDFGSVIRVLGLQSEPEEVVVYCHTLINKWKYAEKLNAIDFINHCCEQCDVTVDEYNNSDKIYTQFRLKANEIVAAMKMLVLKELHQTEYYTDPNTGKRVLVHDVLNNLLIVIGNAMNSILSLNLGMTAMNPYFDSSVPMDERLDRIENLPNPKMQDNEILIRWMLGCMQHHGYRKFGTLVFSKVFNDKGQFTHAWECKDEISSLVNKVVSKEQNATIWRILNAKANNKFITNYLETCDEIEFPELVRDRSIFSFKNGLYKANEHKFYPYDTSTIPEDVVAAKYFPLDFEYHENTKDWYNDIKTPAFQSILEPQFKDEEEYHDIAKVAYILIGRMLYNLGEKDDWQVMAFFKGMAQTGKSTILKTIVKQCYEASDVGILSNECAENFPIENLFDKKIFIALDIDNKFRLPQMTFQSMVSGEDVSVMRKHKTPMDIEWSVPGAMSGNELFGYSDNGGSIGRRIVLFEFMKTISSKQLDSNLTQKLKEEFPIILQKCNVAYLEASSTWSKTNIWKHLPSYFIKNRAYLLEQTNSMLEFLTSDQIAPDLQGFVGKDEFIQEYMSYCKEHALKHKRFSKDTYSSPFAIMGSKYNIPVSIVRNPIINGIKRKGQYITGIRLNTFSNDALDEADPDEITM